MNLLRYFEWPLITFRDIFVKEGKEEWLSARQGFRLHIWGYMWKKKLESWQDNKEKLIFVTCLWPNKKERNDFY